MTGTIDVLRGHQPPPPAKFPTIRTWTEDTIYHEGDIVAFAGGTSQALHDTARAPGAQDWVCLATPGNSLTVRGTYDKNGDYRCLDVVMIGGSSFVALKDRPGPCPGDDWQLLSSRGSRGDRGLKGERGFTGPKGERGQAARVRGPILVATNSASSDAIFFSTAGAPAFFISSQSGERSACRSGVAAPIFL